MGKKLIEFMNPEEEDRYFKKVMDTKIKNAQMVTAVIVTLNLLLLIAYLAIVQLQTKGS